MSRFYIFLVNVVVIAMMISVVITSEKVNRASDRIERPIMIRVSDMVSQNRNVVPFIDSSSVFFLHLLKYKPQYQKLDKINSTTAAPVTTACICVPFYLCDNNQTIITDGSGVIDVRWVNHQSSIINWYCAASLLRSINFNQWFFFIYIKL